MATLTLRTYLDTRRTTAADWNVTGMGTGPNGWTGKFKIPEEEYDAFLQLAHDHIFTRGRACSLLEKHKPNSPILIDLDFRYPAGGPLCRRFTYENIRDFVAAYADAFAHFFEPPLNADDEPTLLQFFVMLKPAAEADPTRDAHKDGIHIVCPTVTTSPEIQYAIRGHLLQTGVIERIFGPTGMMNPPQDCLDISVVQRNNWFLYGACKPDKAWYKVEHVFGLAVPDEPTTITSEHIEEEGGSGGLNDLELIRLLSIRRGHDHLSKLSLRPGVEGDWVQLIQRWGKGSNWAKSTTASPSLFGKMSTPIAADDGATMETLSLAASGGGAGGGAAADMIQVGGISVRDGYSVEDIALAYKLTRECLNPMRRCKDYQDWINTGLLLHNISDTPETMKVWAELSRRVPGYNKTPDATYSDKWKIFPAIQSAQQRGRKTLMMGTLCRWAKEDSPAAYMTIIREIHTDIAMLNDNGSHVAIAEVVTRMYKDEFRCSPAKKGATAAAMNWYQYTGHGWHAIKTCMCLRARLSNEVRNVYFGAEKKVIDRVTASTNEDERAAQEVKLKNIRKIEAQLQNSGFKDSVMKELTEKFYDEEFTDNMNRDITLVGFTNGVLELRCVGTDSVPHVKFREGRPDDCISFQMGRSVSGTEGIPYIPYDPAHPEPEHLEVLDFFKKLYPDPVLRHYVMKLDSACLEGANHEQKFYVMSGCGGNGKSKHIDLMSRTFGEYQEVLAVQALTRKRADAGNATPEMVPLKNKRFISMVEPEEGERINTSLMKQMTGGDMLKARGLFQDQDEFVITGRIFMSCNDLPPVSSMDEGTWRRICVIPHVARFVPTDKPANPAENIHHRDPLLDMKIVRWRPYFAGILVWYYENHYLREGLKEPDCVTAASAKYKEENDKFAAFAQDCLIKEVGGEVTGNDVYIRYTTWQKFNPSGKILQKKDVLQKMEEKFGRPQDGAKKTFVGVRLAEEGEDVSGNVLTFH